MLVKDVGFLILENFKNRKEVYLFSRVYNCRFVESGELGNWYFVEVFFIGWI